MRRIFTELFLGEILFVQKYDNACVGVGLNSFQEMDMFSFVLSVLLPFVFLTLVIPHFLSDLLVF